MNKSIFGFKISMHEIIIDHLFHTFKHISENMQGFMFRQRSASFFGEVFSQVSSITERSDNIGVGGLFEDISSIDYMVTFKSE